MNQSQQFGVISPLLPQAQPPSLEDSADFSLIIGSVCVVGMVLFVSVFVYILCRLCRCGSYSNRALLGKVTAERNVDGGDCLNGVVNGSATNGRKPKLTDSNNGIVHGADGRFFTFNGTTIPTSAFCLTNTMAASDSAPSPSKPIDMFSHFNGNGEFPNLPKEALLWFPHKRA